MTTDQIHALSGEALSAAAEEHVAGRSPHATTDADFASAVMDGCGGNRPNRDGSNTMPFTWNGRPHEWTYHDSYFNYKGADGNAGYGLRVWEVRHGAAWQADLEAHVAAWRRKAPDWTCWAKAGPLFEEWAARCGWRLGCGPLGWHVTEPGEGVLAYGDTPGECICRAALVHRFALEGK